MAEGISPNPLNKISQVYLDRIAKINSDPEIAQKEREKWQTEAKVDTGSAAEKATARNKRNTPAGKDYDFDNKVFITRKPGESLDSARTRKRREAHAAKRGVSEARLDETLPSHATISSVSRGDLAMMALDDMQSELKKRRDQSTKNRGNLKKRDAGAMARERLRQKQNEGFSDWRTDLREIVDEIESEAEKKVEEKKGIKNKVVINPKLTETVENMGGRLLEVKEIDDEKKKEQAVKKSEDEKEDNAAKADLTTASDDEQKADALKKKEAMLKKRIVRMKMMAVNQGAGETILASYDPMDDPDFDHDEAEKNRGVSGKNNPKGGKKLKDILKKVEEGKLTSVKATTYGMPPEERKAHIDAERKRQGVKPKPEKKIEEEVGISSTEKMAAARKEAELRKREDEAVKKQKGEKQKAAARKKSVSAKKHLTPSELKKYDTDGDGKVRVVNASFSNWKKELIEKDLNAKERRALPDKDFVFPGKGEGPEGKQRGAYPIPDKSHARNALAMAAAHASPAKEAKVKAAVKKKFPGIQQEDYDSQKKKEVLDAMKRQGRKLSDKDKEKIATKVVKDKGDTSKSDDRYAYESVVRPKGQDSDKEVNKATRKAAFRPFANTKPPKLKVAEDKAFDNVVGKLRKKYGKDAVLTKDSPKPKPQPRPEPKPDTRTPEQKKKDQDHANVMARYGGEANYKAGRGLGT